MAKELKTAQEIADIFKSKLKESGYDLRTINIVQQGEPGDWRPVFAGSSIPPTELTDDIRDTLRNTYQLRD